MKRDMRKHKPVIMMWAAQYDEKKKITLPVFWEK